MSSIEKTANQIREYQEKVYVPRHEYRPIEASAFKHLDLSYYERTRDSLVGQGCICLGDFENLTLKGTVNDFRTFIRLLVSADGSICVGLYHPKPKFLIRLLVWILRVKVGRGIDCETEFSNGGYLVTSNAAEAGKLTMPPGFNMKFFPAETDPDIVFQSHDQRLKEFLAANPGVSATSMRTSDEALAMQHRMQSAKADFRKSIGYATEAELQKLGADAQTAAQIKQAMDRPEN